MTAATTASTRTMAGLAAAVLGLLLVFFAGSAGGTDGSDDAIVTTTTTPTTTTTTTPATTTTGVTSTTAGSTTTTAVSTTTTASTDAALIAQGEEIFLHTAGGVGCAYCHGVDGKGKADVAAPDIRGKDYAAVSDALITRAQMSFITLTDPEIRAVAAYLATLP